MATLTPTLTLTSTDASSDELNITVTDSLTVTQPSVGLSRLVAATGAATEILDDALDAMAYIFIKNTDDTNYVSIATTKSTVSQFARLNPGEFMFFCVQPDAGVSVQANTATCVVEYAYWTKG
jgi:ABC-type Fe3+-hydroxamate transport system substrate-binding protein